MVKVTSPPRGSAHSELGCMAGVWTATEASVSVVLVLEGLRKAGASRGWCWLPGALILGAACAGLRHHHRDTGGAPAPECRPSGVGSLLPPPPPPAPLLARARALSLSADPHAADSALAFFPRNVARGHAAG